MTKWISVKDRLPEIHVHVLTYEPKSIGRMPLKVNYIHNYENEFMYGDGITHWMPLPNFSELIEGEK